MLSSGHSQQQVLLKMRASLAVISMDSSAPCSSPASPVPLAGRRRGRPAQQPRPAGAPAARTSQPRPRSGQAPAAPCCARRRGPCKSSMNDIMQTRVQRAGHGWHKPASWPGAGTVTSQHSCGGMLSCLGLVLQLEQCRKLRGPRVEVTHQVQNKRDECSRQAPA